MPSIEDGGVEKNLFLISNFLIKKFNNVSLITVSNKSGMRITANVYLAHPHKLENDPKFKLIS